MKTKEPSQPRSRMLVAVSMLSVFLAYLVYLPIHAISGEHCLPGADESAATLHEQGGHDHFDPLLDLHPEHEHSDGTKHHQHHTTDEDELEFAGKIGALKWLATDSGTARVTLASPADVTVSFAQNYEILPLSFSPGHWLISRGPPIA